MVRVQGRALRAEKRRLGPQRGLRAPASRSLPRARTCDGPAPPSTPAPAWSPASPLPSFIISSLDSARHDRSPDLKRRAGSSDTNTPPTHHDPPGAHRNPQFPRKVSRQGPRGPPGSHPAARCREVSEGSGTGGSRDPRPRKQRGRGLRRGLLRAGFAHVTAVGARVTSVTRRFPSHVRPRPPASSQGGGRPAKAVISQL